MAVRNSPPVTGFGGSECPQWGPLEGHWAGQRLFPKSRLGLGLWPGPCLGSPGCFLHPLFHGLPALPEGIQAPGAVSRQGKGLKPQRWHMGKTLLGWGSPKRGFRAIPELLGRAPWRQQGSGEHPGKGEDLGLIPVIYPQIPALEGLWGTRAGLGLFPGRGWPGGGNAGREGNARKDGTCAGNSRAGKSGGPAWPGSL